MNTTVNILIVGVGGQGTLLASRVLGNIAMRRGYDVKVSEVHGMAQRGGSVVTYVRYGEKIASPLIEPGGADYMIAFEKLEALRWLDHLKPQGTAIVNMREILPMPVITGAAAYPQNALAELSKVNACMLDALELARESGNPRTLNMVMIGVLAAQMGEDAAEWADVIKETVPVKAVDVNLKAFEKGYACQVR